MCSQLKKRGVATETVRRAEHDPSFPIKILPARYLTKLYQELGMYIHTYCSPSYLSHPSPVAGCQE